jgi:hypothetical protein
MRPRHRTRNGDYARISKPIVIRKFKFRRALPLLPLALTALLAGCGPQNKTQVEAADSGTSEFRDVANAVLGNGAEIIAQGDLARNGSEQLLVINRFGNATAHTNGNEKDDPDSIPITRAVIMEKNSGKWTEVLRCDERLKNPRGYLDGTHGLNITGWLIRFRTDAPQGIELQFTPLGSGSGAIEVQWNANVKRFQSMDRIHKKFMGEDSALEPSPSILK